MADNSWKHLELWDRVKWARSRRFASAIAAAVALDMKDGTYRCYERGPGSAKFIPLDYKHAKLFAQLFKVRWEWLLDGLGEPWLTEEDADQDGEAEGEAPSNLRAWREHRSMTVAELAKKSGLGAQTIIALEAGEMDLSVKLLNKLADALNTTSGYVLDVNPDDSSPELFDAVRAVPKERRSQALEILKTFRPYKRLR
ncbi:MAG TPA: helix-turn-helix transcriptional regulator [Caulobacteraceae bacterium]|nr:helix-turn-helix transcriptional regulator [Caulobacteraceae bacterium]